MITIDEAATRAEQAGLATLDKRYWKRQIDRDLLTVHDGVVPYLEEAEIMTWIDNVLATRKEADRGR